MHIPSDRVYNEMRSENASLWYVPANSGRELALLIKAPTSSIKALVAGCPLTLLFGKSENHICTGVEIHDIPDAPVVISGVQREPEEQHALARFLQEQTIPVFLNNEMDICLAWTNLRLAENGAARISNCLGDMTQWYVGSFDAAAAYALDCFGISVDHTAAYPNAHPIPVVEIEVALEKWRIVRNYFCGIRGYEEIKIDDSEEGKIFERAIWASLESVFPLTLYKSPQIKDGKGTRELTDVFSFYPYGSFLIEAKDLSVLNAGYDRSQARRTTGVQKQIKKAIAQLIGASKKFSRGNDIFDSGGEKIEVDREQPPHCIVLITELMHWGDWEEITKLLFEAMRETGAFFHLLDLRELIALLKASSGRAEILDYNLMQRCKFCMEKNTVLIRGIPAP